MTSCRQRPPVRPSARASVRQSERRLSYASRQSMSFQFAATPCRRYQRRWISECHRRRRPAGKRRCCRLPRVFNPHGLPAGIFSHYCHCGCATRGTRRATPAVVRAPQRASCRYQGWRFSSSVMAEKRRADLCHGRRFPPAPAVPLSSISATRVADR